MTFSADSTNDKRSPPYSDGSGSAKTQSGCALGGFLLHHILPALVLLRKPLFGLSKRQLPRTSMRKVKPQI